MTPAEALSTLCYYRWSLVHSPDGAWIVLLDGVELARWADPLGALRAALAVQVDLPVR